MKTNQEKFSSILYGKKILVGLFPLQLNTKQLLRAFCRNKSHSCTLPLAVIVIWDTTTRTTLSRRRIDVMVGSPSQSHGEHMNYFLDFLRAASDKRCLGVSHPTWTKNDQPSIHWLNQKTHVRLSDSRMNTVSRNGYKAITSRIIAFYYQDTDKTDCFLSSNFLHACMLYKVNKIFTFIFSVDYFSCIYLQVTVFGASKEKRCFNVSLIFCFYHDQQYCTLRSQSRVNAQWFCLSYLSCFVPSLV